jgi:hypothetical protein
LGERLPVLVGALCAEDLTGTSWPPWLVQLTVAVYVATNDPVAFALPTPFSWNELHVTKRVVASTEQPTVPDWRWVPFGALAGLIVVVDVAAADPANSITEPMMDRMNARSPRLTIRCTLLFGRSWR